MSKTLAELKAAANDPSNHASTRVLAYIAALEAQLDEEKERADSNFQAYERIKMNFSDKHNEAKALERSCTAMDLKIRSLSVHETCGCSYDQPGDVCLHHSPKLVDVEAERCELRDACKAAMDLIRNGGSDWAYRELKNALAKTGVK